MNAKNKKKPVVAIVGRPNVGKSTLFNRIIRRREAIVNDQAGITRDRKYADTDWEGFPFTLIDTGGYISKSNDVIENGVKQQVLTAIQEADLVLFLVDCTTGITDLDGDVAELLRKHEKPTILVVNKVDNEGRQSDAALFYRLGLGEPVTISALMGREIGDLLSMVVEGIGRQIDVHPNITDQWVKLAIVGRPNVGKSTFINKLLGENRLLVTEIPGTTRDSVDVYIKQGDREFVMIDTAGLRRKSRVQGDIEYYSTIRTRQAISQCDVSCVFIDAGEGVTQQDMAVIRSVIDEKKGVILVANKWDLMRKNQDKTQWYYESLERRMEGAAFIPVITISSKTGLRVNKVLEKVWEIAIRRQMRVSSPILNRMLEKINQRFQPPSVAGKRIKIQYTTQIRHEPPVFAFFSNHPDLIKAEYKRFLENQIREHFGFEGVPIGLVFKRKK